MEYNTVPIKSTIMAILLISLSTETRTYNYSEIIKKYFLMCGPQNLCNQSIVNFTSVYETLYDKIGICPECSCNESCIIHENCCPDVFFKLPVQSYEDVVILDSTKYHITEIFPIVKSCPVSSGKDLTELCLRKRTVVDRILLPPVTSLSMPITYHDKYCAMCNGEFNVSNWNLNISCYQFSDFNYFSSYQQVIDEAYAKECTIRFKPSQSNIRVLHVTPLSRAYYNKCNMTGFWSEFDTDIRDACESSTYVLRYKQFKNIFCYMCNPTRKINPDVIGGCNETGIWKPYDHELEVSCQTFEQIDGRHPFRNIFCYFCNRNNYDTELYQDVSTKIDQWYHAPLFPEDDRLIIYYIQVNYFKLPFYKTLVFPQNGNYNNFTSFKPDQFNMTNVLMKAYARNPSSPGLCNENILPLDVVQIANRTWSFCSCDPASFFNSHSPCLDISLRYPITCLSNVVQFGYLNRTVEEFYMVTSGCYQHEYSSVVNDRCNGHTKDAYTSLPVIDTISKIQYKNFDCYVCNKFKNLEVKNNFVDYISKNDYFVPVTVRIICHDIYVDFSRYLFIHEGIETAKLSNCRISFIASRDMQRCMIDDTVLQKCNQTGYWDVLDPDINWLCENLSEGSLPLTSSISGNMYKNMYCSMCNPVGIQGAIISSCNTTGFCPRIFDDFTEPGCEIFPMVEDCIPFKNQFCLNCNTYPCSTFYSWPVTTEFAPLTPCDLEPFSCNCLGAGCVAPLDIPGVKIRNLFRVSETETNKIKQDKCSDDQIMDEVKVCID